MNDFELITVPTFSDFVAEIPADTSPENRVRLVLTERITGQPPMTYRDVTLDLQGVSRGRLVWLSEQISMQWVNGKPFGDRALSKYAATSEWAKLVQRRLDSLGYQVLPGRWITPADWHPINGFFDCVRWSTEGDTVYVRPAWEEDPADPLPSES